MTGKRRIQQARRHLQTARAHLRAAAVHVYKCWLNNQSVPEKVKMMICGCTPMVIWLVLSNSLGVIPNHIKPDINVRLIMRLDSFVFDDYQGSHLTNTCLAIGGYLLYHQYQRDWVRSNKDEESGLEVGEGKPVGCEHVEHSESFELSEHPEMLEPAHKQLDQDFESFDYITPPKQMGLFQLFPILTILLSWIILRGVDLFKEPISKPKTIVAIVFYLIGHFVIFPVSIGYLYLFHPSSVLKQFMAIMGVQNICITLTHFVFPNVPPVFIQLYGENKIPSYDTPGYTEGLNRLDVFKFNNFLNNVIDYVRASEFGIFPSLYSSMAIMIMNYLMDLMVYKSIKVILLAYLMVQIWSSIYLDHHWRLDILFSFVYTNVLYVFVRSQSPYPVKSTMGMRLFKNTSVENWFNPYTSSK